MLGKMASAFVALIATTGISAAATVTPIEGSVLVNGGEGFSAVTGKVVLSEGARVMVRPGGQATIAYTADCTHSIVAGEIVTIPAAGICPTVEDVAAAPEARRFDDAGRVIAGPEGRTTVGQAAEHEERECLPGVTVTQCVVGALVVGGVTAGIIAATDDDDDDNNVVADDDDDDAPVSP